MATDKEKLAVRVFRRIVELEIQPVQGTFDVRHLKEIHRRIFQDVPQLGGDMSPGEFRQPVEANLDWVKTRRLESVTAVSNVAYSTMSADVQKNLDNILSKIDVQQLSRLNKEEFTKLLASVYVSIDYIHPFRDGNSRTLRTFTRQIAKESGYFLHWEALNTNPLVRDMVYIARDISVNNIALNYVHSEFIRRDIQCTLDQLGHNRDILSLLSDIVQPMKGHTPLP